MDGRQTRPKDWREARRKRALELKVDGWKQREIAYALDVSEAAVSQWLSAIGAPGVEPWRAKPHRQGPLKLTRQQLHLLPDLLSHGAEAYGFRGEVWTCARVAAVIRQEFGVSYHKSHVSRLLKAVRWTPQMPIARAMQRDETRIQEWRVVVCPELKKRRCRTAIPLFLWMNPGSICCRAWCAPMHLVVRHPCCTALRRGITWLS